MNGRVMYRNCRVSEMSDARLEMVLGGPIYDPMGYAPPDLTIAKRPGQTSQIGWSNYTHTSICQRAYLTPCIN